MEDHEFRLLDFTDEILIEIFSKFTDIELLNTAQVCRRFKAISKEIFRRKYNGDSDDKYYEIKVHLSDTKEDHKLYRTILKMFGNEIAALNFKSEQSSNQHNNIVKLVGQYCRSTRYVTIEGKWTMHLTQMIQSMSKLTKLSLNSIWCANFYWTSIHFPHLTTFSIYDVNNMDVELLKQFLYVNPQLENLHILACRRFPLKVIQALRDKMKRLKSLEFDADENEFGNRCRDINMENLESLRINVDITSFQTVLGAISRGSKMIQKLDIWLCDHESNLPGIHSQMDNVIPLFEKLTSLRLERFNLPVKVTRYLIRFLPNLVSLKIEGVRLSEYRPDDILFIFTNCKHMKDLLLESVSTTFETVKLNLEFHRKFIEIVHGRGCDVKFELNTCDTRMKITPEKMIKNKELIYWIAYEALETQSKVHILDLDDKCLSKIFSYVDEQGERALYETCTRTRHAMHGKIMQQVFTVISLNSAKDTFNRFGEHITKLAIDIKNGSETQATWSFIGTEFNAKITELSLINVKVNAIGPLKIKFPNVTTLKIMSIVSSHTCIFPRLECPKLSQIEFHKGDITFTTKTTNFGLSLDQLTTIKLYNYSKSIGKIVHLLDNKICDQIQEFSIYRTQETYDTHIQISNIAMRFRNMITLNFGISNIETTNTKYLFASCTKLKKVSFGYDSYLDLVEWRRTLRNIKDNCKHLEVFQLVRSCNGFDQDFLNIVADMFPKVKLYAISYDDNKNTYTVELFQRIARAKHNTPF